MACFTRQNLKDVYQYMKDNYIDQGKFRNDIEGLLNQVGKDLNRNPEELARVLTTPKTLRVVSNDMYAKYANRRRARNNADTWLKARNDPALTKAFNALNQMTYATRVLGHGPVSFGVHAAPYLYMPTRYKIMGRNYLKAWKNFSDASYEKMARAIENDPEFKEWNKASKGSIDPAQHLDDMQAYADWAAQKYGKAAVPYQLFATLSRKGSQQFQGIKMLRLELMKDYWNRLSPHLRTEVARDRIGDYVNHMTGVSPRTAGFRSTVGNLAFAPSLESARWLRMSDVQQTVRDLFNFKDPALQRFAVMRMRDYSEMVGTYMLALQANDKIFLNGSGQHINFNDRTKSDYLLPKRANGDTINLSGGEINTIRFLMNFFGKQYDYRTGKELKSGPGYAQRAETLGRYGMGKASPLAGSVMDAIFGTAYGEGGKQAPLPVPWAPPPSKGVEPFTIPEYLAERQAPIPASGAAQSYFSERQRGAPVGEALESGIIPFIVEGLAGGRYQKAKQ